MSKPTILCFQPKKSKSGNDLPPARKVRTSLLSDGRVPSQIITQLAVNVLVFLISDIVSQHDTVNYIYWKPYCCSPKGVTDKECVPNKIPNDDPVFRFSDIRCLNMTRPQSFQSVGCIANNSVPERVVSTTPLLDLSVIYGDSNKMLEKKGRLFKGGLLKYEISNGRIWPPSATKSPNLCVINDNVRETRCHVTPNEGVNTLAGTNIIVIWFWRLHNLVARNLATVNPSWNDDKLFYTARDICISISLQIYYYELLPVLLGHENLVKDGLISLEPGFRDLYDKNVMPQISVEFPYVLRWVHLIQDGFMKMYDKDGYYLKQYPIVNLTLRTGFFDVDDNINHITQGTFRQGSANFDYILDPDIGSLALGSRQRASDIVTNDLAKSRYFGLQSYVKYREFCFGTPIKSYADLRGVIDNERVEILKDAYESTEDIELIAGIWVEKPIRGGFVPPTFYCLVVDQFMRNIVSDRHWYERPNRPKAFTYEQLLEIRKYTIARLLCDVGDTVSKIQPNAFLKADKNVNQMRDCEDIPNINYWAWHDSSYQPNKD